MSRTTGTARAVQDLIRHCHGGLDVPGVHAQFLHSMRKLIPVDAAFFATADPDTLLFTGAFADEPLDTVTPLFMDNEFGGSDVNRFAALAISDSHVASLDSATHSDRWSSGRYREIMRPLGLGDELRAALVTGSQCWGYLCLHREDRPLGFTDAEAALIASIAPHLAHALRQAVLLHGSPATGVPGEPGVVLLAEDLGVVAVTPEAAHLLSLVEETRSIHLPLPLAVYSVAMAVRAIEQGTAPVRTLPTSRVRTRDGHWLTLHASRLQGPPGERRISVVVKIAETAATIPLMLAAHGLSPREAEVARLVLRGNSTQLISDTLHITPHTVQDHLKAVFDKVGVRSRRDLVGRLLQPPGTDG